MLHFLIFYLRKFRPRESRSKKEQRKRSPSPEIPNCASKHEKLKKWEHDVSIIYAIDEYKFTKNQFNSKRVPTVFVCR